MNDDPNPNPMGSGSPPMDEGVQGTPQAAPEPKCATCSMDTSGYKCAQCGEESATHDENHACGGAMCQPKCIGCNEAESKCHCGATQANTGETGAGTGVPVSEPPVGGTPPPGM